MLPAAAVGVAVAVTVAVTVGLTVAVAVSVGDTTVGATVAVTVIVGVTLTVGVAFTVAVGVAALVAVGVGVGLELAGFRATATAAQFPALIMPASGATVPAAPSVLSPAASAKREPLTKGTTSREVRSLGKVRLLLPPLMNPTYSSLLELVVSEHKVGVEP